MELLAKFVGCDSEMTSDSTRGTFAQKQALVLRMLFEAATEEKMQQICEALVEKAAEGSLGAVQLVFRYLMGKAASQLEPFDATQPSGVGRWEKQAVAEASEPAAKRRMAEATPSGRDERSAVGEVGETWSARGACASGTQPAVTQATERQGIAREPGG